MSSPMRRLFPFVLLVLLLAAAAGAVPTAAQAAGVTVTYAAGWNLVAFPPGTDLSGVAGPLYIYQPQVQTYANRLPAAGLPANTGAWVYFTAPTTVVLGTGSTTLASVGLMPAQPWALLGNPSGTAPAVIRNAVAYSYDPLNGYQPTDTVLPGQGVWVTPAQRAHSAITLTPVPAGDSGLTTLAFTSPCGAALGTQGYAGGGNGTALGTVDGQPVSLCRASGPRAVLPVSQGFVCLLVSGRLATLDGGPACGGATGVVAQGPNQLRWTSHLSAAAQTVVVVVWDGGSFRANPSATVCVNNATVPVTSADQCGRQP